MKNIILILTLCACNLVNGQTLVNLHPVSGFQIASDNLLDFDVVAISRGETKSVNVSFRITVSQNEIGNKTFLEMYSSKHILARGVNSFNISNINIIRKKFLNQEFANYEAKMRSFPIGSYNYCVEIICEDAFEACEDFFVQENSQRQCSEFSILPMSPLLLAIPEDEDILKIKRPNFNWIPPMPLGSDPDISYELTLVHLNTDQKGEDGIRRNRPIYQRDGIQAINMPFPTTLEDLEAGEHYAWQVQAYLGKILAATSEVWEFEIKSDPISKPGIFVREENTQGVYHYTSTDTVFLIHENKYTVEDFALKILNDNYEPISNQLLVKDFQNTSEEGPEFVNSELFLLGKNSYGIPLSQLNLDPGNYIIQILTKDLKKINIKISISE